MRWLQWIVLCVLTACSLSAWSEDKIFTTPYFRIPLSTSMEQIASDELEQNAIAQHMYLYSAHYPDIEDTLTINVVSLPANAQKSTNSDKQQKQYIVDLVEGLHEKIGQHPDATMTYDQVKTVKLKNREFKSYTLHFENGVIKIYATIKQKKIYAFLITCYSDNKNTLNQHVDLLTQQIAQVHLE